MVAELLVKTKEKLSLDSFVSNLPSYFGCDRWEKRESSNYVGERYYRCLILGIEITVSIADNSEFQCCDFEIFFESCGGGAKDTKWLDGLVDCAAMTLALHDLVVIRPLDVLKTGGGAATYRLDKTKLAETPLGQVVIESI